MDEIDLLHTLKWRGIDLTLTEFYELKQLVKAVGIHNIIKESRSLSLKERVLENKKWLEQGQREWEWLLKYGAKVTLLGDSNYPNSFYNLKHPPLMLTYFGEPTWLTSPVMAVVGSRRPNTLSETWLLEEFTNFLRKTPLAVVSGGAMGIDQLAHSMALRLQRPTICFLPSGLRKPYPQNIKRWFDPIVEGCGAIVSQFSPFAEIYKSNFYFRNALIVQLAQCVFVVEAQARSGSMLTAQLALRINKELVTLPCAPAQNFGRGNLNLIFDGAHWVRDAQDLESLWSQLSFLG